MVSKRQFRARTLKYATVFRQIFNCSLYNNLNVTLNIVSPPRWNDSVK